MVTQPASKCARVNTTLSSSNMYNTALLHTNVINDLLYQVFAIIIDNELIDKS